MAEWVLKKEAAFLSCLLWKNLSEVLLKRT